VTTELSGPHTQAAANTDVATLRVLLLEDNPADARLVQERLQDSATTIGWDVAAGLWQTSPQRLGQADCALIDLGLPDASGLETIQRIRDMAPELPIVVLTGRDDEATGAAALRSGAQDFLVKDHADGFLIGRAIRLAIVRMRLHLGTAQQTLHDQDRRDDIVKQLYAIGLGMKTTQTWSRQPTVAARISDHRHDLENVMQKIRDPR
jgi:DNA-binding response OmpR family regulator